MRSTLGRAWSATARYRIPIAITLLLIFLGIYIWREHDQIGASLNAMRDADRSWISLALAIQVFAIGTLALSYVAVMRLLGHHLGFRRLARLHLRRMAVATVTPAGSATSIYVFVKSVENDNVSASDALLTIGLRGACGYAAFVLLLPAAIVLHEQTLSVQLAAIALSLVLALMVFMLRSLLGGERPPAWIDRLPSRLVRFVDQARRHDIHVRGLALPALYSLTSKLASVGVVYCALLAVGYDAPLSTALVGYVVANISQAVAPVFGGFGVVELTMAIALEQLGVPTPQAIAAALIFRLCDLWFQLGLGLIAQVQWGALFRRLILPAGAPDA